MTHTQKEFHNYFEAEVDVCTSLISFLKKEYTASRQKCVAYIKA